VLQKQLCRKIEPLLQKKPLVHDLPGDLGTGKHRKTAFQEA